MFPVVEKSVSLKKVKTLEKDIPLQQVVYEFVKIFNIFYVSNLDIKNPSTSSHHNLSFLILCLLIILMQPLILFILIEKSHQIHDFLLETCQLYSESMKRIHPTQWLSMYGWCAIIFSKGITHLDIVDCIHGQVKQRLRNWSLLKATLRKLHIMKKIPFWAMMARRNFHYFKILKCSYW